ncbi:MAG: transcription termination/antitermination NusG family protein [Thermoanaerobaculia bacterium]
MPLLKCGTEIFPPSLFELPEGDYPWWVAHVRSRQEKALARYLLPLQVPFYLPLREKRSRRSGRTFTSYLPLFRGYLFLRGSGRERHAALRSNLIVRVLDVPDQALLNRELGELRALQRMGASLVPYAPLAAGDVVRVADGPFQGYSGVVVRGAARPRLVVSISVLRKAVAVEFERDVLVPARSPQRPKGDARSAVA